MSTQQPTQKPITQGNLDFRKSMPEWVKQLPSFRSPQAKSDFQLIDMASLDKMLQNVDPQAATLLKEDMQFLDKELLRLFRDRDYEAKLQQNRYRLYQIGYMGLAAAATLIGSLLAVSLQNNNSNDLVPMLGFLETLVALITTYLATISGREQPLPLWLENRRKAEHLRREYYRYLMDLAPYDALQGYDRRRTLSFRAANINRGLFPETDNTQNKSAGT